MIIFIKNIYDIRKNKSVKISMEILLP